MPARAGKNKVLDWRYSVTDYIVEGLWAEQQNNTSVDHYTVDCKKNVV